MTPPLETNWRTKTEISSAYSLSVGLNELQHLPVAEAK